jgi:hypothetical protein
MGAIGALTWPFAFIWFGDDLAETLGMFWGTVNRRSPGSLVKLGGWCILGIYAAAVLSIAARL